MNKTTKRIGKNGVLRLLADLESEGCSASVYVSRDTLAERDYRHLLPRSEDARFRMTTALEALEGGDTGAVVFVSAERTVAIKPPIPLSADIRADGAHTDQLRGLLNSEPVIGVILLRLGRYAVGVMRGETLIATKTDSRYMKNRHRAGGQSQRRFERSRERLIRELYDKTCQVARDAFTPHLEEMRWTLLGGERGVLNGFLKRCPLMRIELRSRTLSRRLAVESPNQKALTGISREVWKSEVSFFELG